MLTTPESRLGKKKAPKPTNEPAMSAFIFRRVVTERWPVRFNAEGDKSPGQILDEMLSNSAKAGEEVSLVSFEILPEDWESMARMFTE
jgi:hypothetical protein